MMLNRRHIRVKVMQTMYAFKGSESDDFSKDQKFLLFSIDNMYNLYLLLISLLIEVQKRAENDLQKKQKKHLATKEDKDPNRKFVNNQLLKLLKENLPLKDQLVAHNVNNWDLDGEYIDLIFKDIIASDLYKDYMKTRVSDFKEDKNFVVDVFKDIIAPNEKLYDYMLEKGYIDLKGKVQDSLKTDLKNNDVEIPEAYDYLKTPILKTLKKIAGNLNVKDAGARKHIKINKQIFLSEEFKSLWDKVKYKTTYSVAFDTEKLIDKCAESIRDNLVAGRGKFVYKKARTEITKGGVEAKETATSTSLVDSKYINLPDVVSYLQNVIHFKDAKVKYFGGM